jgi:hypothetical protein
MPEVHTHADMRHAARENGQPEVIEWVEACIAYDEKWFAVVTGRADRRDLEIAVQRKVAASAALSPEQRRLPFLET